MDVSFCWFILKWLVLLVWMFFLWMILFIMDFCLGVFLFSCLFFILRIFFNFFFLWCGKLLIGSCCIKVNNWGLIEKWLFLVLKIGIFVVFGVFSWIGNGVVWYVCFWVGKCCVILGFVLWFVCWEIIIVLWWVECCWKGFVLVMFMFFNFLLLLLWFWIVFWLGGWCCEFCCKFWLIFV